LAFALEKLNAEAAALGIEPRHPYLDRRVVECVLAIPPATFVGDGYRKQFVQRAVGGGRAPRTVERPTEHVPLRDAAESVRDEAARMARDLFATDARIFHYVDRREAERMRDV